MVRETQSELDGIIQLGVFNITKLLKSSESANSSHSYDDGDSNASKKQKYMRGIPIFRWLRYVEKTNGNIGNWMNCSSFMPGRRVRKDVPEWVTPLFVFTSFTNDRSKVLNISQMHF